MPSRNNLMLRSARRARLEARTALMQHLVVAPCAVGDHQLMACGRTVMFYVLQLQLAQLFHVGAAGAENVADIGTAGQVTHAESQ
jgi:hypothetical protein